MVPFVQKDDKKYRAECILEDERCFNQEIDKVYSEQNKKRVNDNKAAHKINQNILYQRFN